MKRALVFLLSALAGVSCKSPASSNQGGGATVAAFSDNFTCEALYVPNGRVEIRSGRTLKEACDLAKLECESRDAENNDTCVVRRFFDNKTTAIGSTDGSGWACEVTENNDTGVGRTWVRPGPTITKAYADALQFCQVNKAGNHCQVTKCFDASYDQL